MAPQRTRLRHPLWNCWCDLKARCSNTGRKDYQNYGGRGIRVCDRWLNSFEAFVEDMGVKPSPHHSIDRIDNHGHYEPGNCRWATRKEQGRNKRNMHMLEHNGVRRCVSEWAEETGLQKHTILFRLRTGWSVADALNTKVSVVPSRHVRHQSASMKEIEESKGEDDHEWGDSEMKLRVKEWEAKFESAKSKGYKIKTQTYLPNKHGVGYMRIMREPDGAAIYGAWCAMIGVLSKQERPRLGYLTDDGRHSGAPFDAETLSMLTLMPVSVVSRMLSVCSSQAIGWLTQVKAESSSGPCQSPDESLAGPSEVPDNPHLGDRPLPSHLPEPLPPPSPSPSTPGGDDEKTKWAKRLHSEMEATGRFSQTP
jgi:hypothetical protein